MNIETLTYLRDNPIKHGVTRNFEISGIKLNEIEHLEELYNNGIFFPKVLKELLFLAGNYCYVLDYGWYDTQEQIQTAAREWLVEYNKNISRPFFVIDIYNGPGQFLYVYLDEGNNPFVYQAYLSERSDMISFGSLNKTLSEYINSLIDRVKQGFNPF